MKRSLQLLVVSVLLISCSQSKNEEAQSDQKKVPDEASSESSSAGNNQQGDEYKIIFNKIDNKALAYINDSLFYDSETIAGNPDLEIEIDLSKYVAEGKYELRVELYNGVEPYNQADSHWELVYDIFKNGEIVEFVREASDNGDVEKVFEEIHFLDELE